MLMTIVCIALMVALLAFSGTAMDAARTAMYCFGTGVLPALLPMMILGKMLPHYTKAERSEKSLWMGSVFFSFAAGSPASAQRAAGMCGRFSRKSWECLLCLTGVMSPMFFTGTLADWLGSVRDGWVLLGLHWLGAAATAGIWAMIPSNRQRQPLRSEQSAEEHITLPGAIAQSAQSLLCVCGAMMLFSIAASLVRSVLGIIFPMWTARHAKWLAVMWAVLEIGGGSSAVISTVEAPHAWLSALCGFGGLSIWLQNLLFLDEKIRPEKLLLMRAVHGAVCYALVKILNPF